MPKYYKSNTFNPIIWQMNKANISKHNLCKLLGSTLMTINNYIENPKVMRLEHIILMSSIFGLSPEQFIYLLIRDKPQLKKVDSWYLSSIIKDL